MGSNGRSRPSIGPVLVLDIQALVWCYQTTADWGIRSAWRFTVLGLKDDAAVSAMTFWKIVLMYQRRRLTLLRDIGA